MTLSWAHPLVQDWFTAKFGTPTEPQEQGWPSILAGKATLISAPTGSGKTFAAFFLWDQMDHTVKYKSKYLANNIKSKKPYNILPKLNMKLKVQHVT